MSLAHATKGNVIAAAGSAVVFQPLNTTYNLHLQPAGQAPAEGPLAAVIRITARKVYTVPSGGLFVSPIMGVPKIFQGRVIDAADGAITLDCGVVVNVMLPTAPGGIEMARGPIAVGSLVNVVAVAGSTLEKA